MAPPRKLSYVEARKQVLGAIHPLAPETVRLSDARGRALWRAVRAPHALPPFRNSSMDGYALVAADSERASGDAPVELPVVEVIPAGSVASQPLHSGQAMRIMTGAQMPEGADAVAPFEEAERLDSGNGERVRIMRPLHSNEFVRGAGEDIASGEEVLPAGRELSPHDLALLASLGQAWVEVGKRPRVTIITTGDELLRIQDPLRPGAIRDGNAPQLRALVEECGCTVVRSDHTTDDAAEVSQRIRRGLETGDAVLTVGGVSAGDFDPVKQSVASLGGTELWRVAMKPGGPQAFGMPQGRMFHGLPGNPASVACVFEALVRPALRRLHGFATIDRPRVLVRSEETVESRSGRTDFVRVTLEWRDELWWAKPAGAQVSGHLMPQVRAHALMIVPEATERLEAGERAEALLLRWPDSQTG